MTTLSVEVATLIANTLKISHNQSGISFEDTIVCISVVLFKELASFRKGPRFNVGQITLDNIGLS